MNDAEMRLLESQNRPASLDDGRGNRVSHGVLVLTADFIYARANSAPPSARTFNAGGDIVRVPVSEVQDGSMHLFSVSAGGQSLRFMIIRKANGWGVALDACRICGAEGYRQDGQNVICRHCASAILYSVDWRSGRMQSIGVPSHLDGGDLVIDISSLTQAAKEIPQ